MKKRIHETGSAHMVITSLLVLALVAALGWVFYYQVMMKDAKNTDVSIVPAPADISPAESKISTKDIQLTNEKLTLSIPKDWTSDIASLPANEFLPLRDNGTISNASNTAVLYVTTGATGLGGACDPDMKNTLTIVEATKTAATTKVAEDGTIFSNDIYAVKSVYYNPEKGYAAFVFLTNVIKAEKTGDEVNTCLPGLSAVYTGKNVKGAIAIATKGGVRETGASEMTYEKTNAEARKQLTSADFTQAYELLKTARY